MPITLLWEIDWPTSAISGGFQPPERAKLMPLLRTQAAYHRDANESARLHHSGAGRRGGLGLILLTYTLVFTAIGLGNAFA